MGLDAAIQAKNRATTAEIVRLERQLQEIPVAWEIYLEIDRLAM